MLRRVGSCGNSCIIRIWPSVKKVTFEIWKIQIFLKVCMGQETHREVNCTELQTMIQVFDSTCTSRNSVTGIALVTRGVAIVALARIAVVAQYRHTATSWRKSTFPRNWLRNHENGHPLWDGWKQINRVSRIHTPQKVYATDQLRNGSDSIESRKVNTQNLAVSHAVPTTSETPDRVSLSVAISVSLKLIEALYL